MGLAEQRRTGSIADRLWLGLYRHLFYPLAVTLSHVAAFGSPKLRSALRQRAAAAPPNEEERNAPGGFRIHFHASSVGEFEQAKPLIERLREESRDLVISSSFFSPSGFRQQGGYSGVDSVTYLPADTRASVSSYLLRLKPDLIVIIRYDLWLEFLEQARLLGIPVVLVCGVLRRDSLRFSPFARGLFRSVYSRLALIHAVGEADRSAFEELAPGVRVEVSGDTRFDRVASRTSGPPAYMIPNLGAEHSIVIVAGSTWPEDETLLAPLADRPELFLVLVPHEPTPTHLAELAARFPDSVTLSDIESSGPQDFVRVVIVDRTGMLLDLYRIADFAYVGGAFGAGVHSVLEPAAYGIPVISGPGISRSRDAEGMREAGVLFSVSNWSELRTVVTELVADVEKRRELGQLAGSFVRDRTGATDRIIHSLREHGLIPEPGGTPPGEFADNAS